LGSKKALPRGLQEKAELENKGSFVGWKRSFNFGRPDGGGREQGIDTLESPWPFPKKKKKKKNQKTDKDSLSSGHLEERRGGTSAV